MRGCFCTSAPLLVSAELTQARSRCRSQPFWDRHGGADHVFFSTNDRGGCGLHQTSAKAIFLSHFGLLGSFELMRTISQAASRMQDADVSTLAKMVGGGEWCFAPHKDVVVPPYMRASSAAAPETTRRANHTLVHSGGIWGPGNVGAHRVSTYSAGMRQRVFLQFGEGRQLGMRILNGSVRDASSFLMDAKLCLAPSGNGFGMRLSQAILANCIPLLAQPLIVQPFEEILDYSAFSARLDRPDEVSQIPQMLDLIDEARVAAMRERLAIVERAFLWDPPHGLAFNYTVASLCRRAVELRGSLKTGVQSCGSLIYALPTARPEPTMPKWFPANVREAVRILRSERRRAYDSASGDQRT